MSGVFQVQRCSVGEKNFGDGPWRTEARFDSLPAAMAYIKANPRDWTCCQTFCDPFDVEALIAGNS